MPMYSEILFASKTKVLIIIKSESKSKSFVNEVANRHVLRKPHCERENGTEILLKYMDRCLNIAPSLRRI